MRIVTGYPVERRHLDQIAAAAPGAEVIEADQAHIRSEIITADVFCGHAKDEPVAWDEVVRRGRLKWIQSSAAGLDHCLTPEVIASDIQVTSASGLFADQVAEQAMALLLGLLRSLPVFFRAAQECRFRRRPTGDLHGATVGIIGFGGNGRRLAEVLTAFRTRILATDVFPIDCPSYVERLLPPESMPEVLAESDVVILCVPLNDTTMGMFDANTLARMKPGSILINVARGKVVVEHALVRALDSQHLQGAGLDVTEIEPLPKSSRLWKMPQVIITPHVGAQSRHRYDDVTDFFCQNLARMQAGRPLLNLVDKQLGFPRRVADVHP